MRPDEAIDAAQDALSRNDPAFASELYESAVRASVSEDKEQAAQLFKLASMYADYSDGRQDKLAAEAQRIASYLTGDDMPIRLSEELEAAGEKIHYCPNRLKSLRRVVEQYDN